MNRLQEHYKNNVIPALKEELGYKNINEIIQNLIEIEESFKDL